MGVNAPHGEKPRSKLRKAADLLLLLVIVAAFSFALASGLESCQQRVLEITRQ
ncbi:MULTISPECIES: hypothetical protein [Pseudomonas]|uniref:H repeat-associated protein N-terminal domain-containing protein n=1 Tax=Pseudomonas extremaustralis TaxID=359110 RepID=A0ABY0MY05_9PSED|nr:MULTISPECIES: hypothetical protein [Pseudomonas]SDE70489.1 hypothetical protein SAMN05216591_0679 [Pseudomonas extremaustralis]